MARTNRRVGQWSRGDRHGLCTRRGRQDEHHTDQHHAEQRHDTVHHQTESARLVNRKSRTLSAGTITGA
jgi:hypothetical protein